MSSLNVHLNKQGVYVILSLSFDLLIRQRQFDLCQSGSQSVSEWCCCQNVLIDRPGKKLQNAYTRAHTGLFVFGCLLKLNMLFASVTDYNLN